MQRNVMSDLKNKELDEYDKKLLRQIDILKKCQNEKSVNSCLSCSQVLVCDIRNEYVLSAYASMHKGNIGGFDFN